jgi:hypothetical protein
MLGRLTDGLHAINASPVFHPIRLWLFNLNESDS